MRSEDRVSVPNSNPGELQHRKVVERAYRTPKGLLINGIRNINSRLTPVRVAAERALSYHHVWKKALPMKKYRCNSQPRNYR